MTGHFQSLSGAYTMSSSSLSNFNYIMSTQKHLTLTRTQYIDRTRIVLCLFIFFQKWKLHEFHLCNVVDYIICPQFFLPSSFLPWYTVGGVISLLSWCWVWPYELFWSLRCRQKWQCVSWSFKRSLFLLSSLCLCQSPWKHAPSPRMKRHVKRTWPQPEVWL